MKSSLESKTVRPGSLGSYALYYHSDRHPGGQAQPPAKAKAKPAPKAKKGHGKLWFVTLVLICAAAFLYLNHNSKSATTSGNSPQSSTSSTAASTATDTRCQQQVAQTVLVSISQRHMWACQSGKQVYDSPVVTGIQYLAADKTPTGTYTVYAKQTDTTLTGSDSTGSWSDPVSYWMPFLHNQYGTYGFHDATWRPANAFGNISPNSADASHGCVELPLATAKWLYTWIQIGDQVTIQS